MSALKPSNMASAENCAPFFADSMRLDLDADQAERRGSMSGGFARSRKLLAMVSAARVRDKERRCWQRGPGLLDGR
jgi:hypothetical protein